MRCTEAFRVARLAAAAALAACSSSPPPPPSAAPGPGPAQPVPGVARIDSHRSHTALRLYAAKRIVDANPGRTYAGPVPDVLLAIPVLEVELHGDGSIRRIDVLRPPRQALDTTQLAIDAVRRAAPFGDVSRLPRPWKFSETFLFDDERRFKLRSLDE